jgi:hypothetical protein
MRVSLGERSVSAPRVRGSDPEVWAGGLRQEVTTAERFTRHGADNDPPSRPARALDPGAPGFLPGHLRARCYLLCPSTVDRANPGMKGK